MGCVPHICWAHPIFYIAMIYRCLNNLYFDVSLYIMLNICLSAVLTLRFFVYLCALMFFSEAGNPQKAMIQSRKLRKRDYYINLN